MTWLTPTLAALVAAVAVPTLVILYFLKLRRRELEISTTLLWKKAVQDIQANAPFQRLRRNILLLLQLLALGAILFGLAQPQMAAESEVGQRHVIMIDRSASMNATDGDAARPGSRTRLEQAKAEALELVDSMRTPGIFDASFLNENKADEAMVIVFDQTAEVRQTFTSDKGLLRRTIEAVEPTDALSGMTSAVRLALAHAPERVIQEDIGLRPRSVGTMHVWTDGRLRDASEVAPGPEDVVVYHPVGTAEAGNTGIVAMRADRSYDDPTQLSVFVGIRGVGAGPGEIDVDLLVEGVVAASKPVRLGSGEQSADGVRTGGVVFELTLSGGGLVAARLATDASDVLAADNAAQLVVPPAKRLAVALVTAGNFYLPEVLSGLPLSRLERFAPEQWETVVSEHESSPFDVIILDGWSPDGALPRGRYLALGVVPAGLGLRDAGAAEAPTVLDWDRDHPALRSTSLSQIDIAETRVMDVEEDAPVRVIAHADAGPLIAEADDGRVRAIVVAFNPIDSTWPFDIGFVSFLAYSTRHLGEDGPTGVAQSTEPGSTIVETLPADASDVRAEGPGGGAVPVSPTSDGRVIVGPLSEVGVYRLSWSGQPGARDLQSGSRAVRLLASNLLDPVESDVRTAPELVLASGTVQSASSGQTRVVRRLWPWLLLGALAVLMLEWYVYNRKVHV